MLGPTPDEHLHRQVQVCLLLGDACQCLTLTCWQQIMWKVKLRKAYNSAPWYWNPLCLLLSWPQALNYKMAEFLLFHFFVIFVDISSVTSKAWIFLWKRQNVNKDDMTHRKRNESKMKMYGMDKIGYSWTKCTIFDKLEHIDYLHVREILNTFYFNSPRRHNIKTVCFISLSMHCHQCVSFRLFLMKIVSV